MATKKTSEETKTSATTPTEKVYTIEQYVQRFGAHPGTVASFKYEARKAGDDLKPRTKAEWDKGLEAQKNRVYND